MRDPTDDHRKVLRVTAFVLIAGAAVLAVRWALLRVDSLGRVRRFPWVGTSVLLVLGVAGLFLVLRHDEEEHRLAQVAATLAGTRVSVHCQSGSAALVDMGSELGYVKWKPDGTPEHSTLIKREQCQDLAHYLASTKREPSQAEVVAVHVLSHEAMHMKGITNEAQAECAAVQRDAETARLLGASADEADRLAREYWTVVYPRMPDDYRTGECSPGGPLDEELPDAPWKQR